MKAIRYRSWMKPIICHAMFGSGRAAVHRRRVQSPPNAWASRTRTSRRLWSQGAAQHTRPTALTDSITISVPFFLLVFRIAFKVHLSVCTFFLTALKELELWIVKSRNGSSGETPAGIPFVVRLCRCIKVITPKIYDFSYIIITVFLRNNSQNVYHISDSVRHGSFGKSTCTGHLWRPSSMRSHSAWFTDGGKIRNCSQVYCSLFVTCSVLASFFFSWRLPRGVFPTGWQR